MNPRRVHELMRQHFPPVRPELRDWVIVADAAGLRHDALRALLDLYIHADAVLVSIHRKTGNLLPRDKALALVAEHLGQREVRMADREFTGFVVIGMNGVAAGWRGLG